MSLPGPGEQVSSRAVPPPGPRDEITFARLIAIVRRWRRLVAIFAIGLPLVTAVVMVFTSNKYTAHGTILVETPEGGLGSDLLGQISAITGFAPQVPPTEMYMAILGSERVALAVIDTLGLADHYGIDHDTPGQREEETLRKLRKRVEFESEDLVSIELAVTDPDPQMAANIVNAYLRTLELANQRLALSRARRTRELVQQALVETEAELDTTRMRMQRYQETYGIFSIDKQTEGTLELIGTLQTQLLAARTEREALGGFASEGSGRARNLDLQINALEAQISKLVGRLDFEASLRDSAGVEIDRRQRVPHPTESFFIPLAELPGLAGQYADILVDLKVQEAKYEVLATQYEQTKIEESQSLPSFEILDWARRPHRKSAPRRTLFVLLALVSGVLSGVLLAVLLDDLSRRIDDSTREDLLGLLPGPVGDRVRRWAGPGA